jgi:hypothetical protein
MRGPVWTLQVPVISISVTATLTRDRHPQQALHSRLGVTPTSRYVLGFRTVPLAPARVRSGCWRAVGRLREILAGKITGRVHDQAQPDRVTLGLPGYSDRLSRSNERLRIGNVSIGVRE